MFAVHYNQSCSALQVLNYASRENQLIHEKTHFEVLLMYDVMRRCMGFGQTVTEWLNNNRLCLKKMYRCRMYDLTKRQNNDFNANIGCFILKSTHSMSDRQANAFVYMSKGVIAITTHKSLVFNITLTDISIALSTMINGTCQKPNFIIHNIVSIDTFSICSNIGMAAPSLFTLGNTVLINHTAMISNSDTITLLFYASSIPRHLRASLYVNKGNVISNSFSKEDRERVLTELLFSANKTSKPQRIDLYPTEHQVSTSEEMYIWPQGKTTVEFMHIYLFSGDVLQIVRLSSTRTDFLDILYAYDGPGSRSPSIRIKPANGRNCTKI